MMFDRSRSSLTVAAVLAIATASFAVACSSAPPPSDPPLAGENSSTKNGSSNKNGSSSNTGSKTGNNDNEQSTDPNEPADPQNPSDPAPTGGACSAEATADACFDCCDTKNPGGLEVDGQAFGQCACESPGVCAQACGSSYCAGNQPTQACSTCLQNATQCETAAETACNANAACKAAIACIQQSGCAQKQ